MYSIISTCTLPICMRSATDENKGFLLNGKILLSLADLEDLALVEKALREVLDDYLTEPQVKGLVVHIQEGGAAEGYRPTVKSKVKPEPGSPAKGPSAPTPHPSGAMPKDQPGPHHDKKPHSTHSQPQGNGSINTAIKKDPGESHADTPMVSAQTGHGRRLESDDQSLFWGTMAGIPWIKAIRAKINAGQDLALWEKLFLVAAFFGRILHWLWHTTWPIAKRFFQLGWAKLEKGFEQPSLGSWGRW